MKIGPILKFVYLLFQLEYKKGTNFDGKKSYLRLNS